MVYRRHGAAGPGGGVGEQHSGPLQIQERVPATGRADHLRRLTVLRWASNRGADFDGFNVAAHISMVGLIGMGNLCFLASTVILTWVVNQEEKLLLAQAQATENPPPDEAEAR